MQVMADAMANLQHPEWFVPDDAVYMAEHQRPQGLLPGGGGKTTGALAVFYRQAGRYCPDALGWQLGMSEKN